MSVLSIFEAVPNRVRAITEIAAMHKGISRSELYQKLQPTAEKPDQFNNLLRETVRIGFLVEDKKSDRIKLNPDLNRKSLRDDESLRRLCMSALIEHSSAPSDENSAFPRAVAWLLTRPVGMKLQWGSEFSSAITDDLNGDEIYDLTNASRSQMMGYWAQYLGFMEWNHWDGVTYCNPDPTRAIAPLARGIFPTGTDLPIQKFLSELSARLPVLEGGQIRDEVEARLRIPRDERTLSESTSLALLRLETRRDLTLSQPSDAEAWILRLMDEPPRRVSHVSISSH